MALDFSLVITPGASTMPRKAVQLVFPDTSFRDDVLSVPGYTFEKVCLVDIVSQKPFKLDTSQAAPWHDTGGVTILAEGSSFKDGSSVLAKIAPAQSNGSMCLEREAHMYAPYCS